MYPTSPPQLEQTSPNAAASVVAAYRFHGLSIEVSADAPELATALHARLRQFATSLDVPSDMRFIYRGVAEPEAHWVARPPSEARPIYDPREGAVTYLDGFDTVFITLGERVRVLCRPTEGTVEVSYLHSELEQPWSISHPIFTLPLLELLKRRGYYNVHAASLCVGDRGMLIAGKSGAGKSTLTLALIRAGFGFLGDDMVFLSRASDGLRMLAFPDEIDVTDETVTFFPELRAHLDQPKAKGWHKRQVWAEQLPHIQLASTCRPAAIVFPRIANTEQSRIEPVATGAALIELVPNVLLTESGASRAHLESITELVRTTPCYRLHTGRDLAEAAEQLRRLLA